jgi:hypothetical protein
MSRIGFLGLHPDHSRRIAKLRRIMKMMQIGRLMVRLDCFRYTIEN